MNETENPAAPAPETPPAAPAKRGRKPRPDRSTIREVSMVFSATSDEAAKVRANAQAEGKSVSAYVRSFLPECAVVVALCLAILTSGCSTPAGVALATGVAVVKPIACDVAQRIVDQVCGPDAASSGGEAE